MSLIAFKFLSFSIYDSEIAAHMLTKPTLLFLVTGLQYD